jgi:hypothetical protein
VPALLMKGCHGEVVQDVTHVDRPTVADVGDGLGHLLL